MATATVPREKPAAIAPPASPIIVRIPVDQVDVGANVRTDVGDLAELVESIRQHGILQPIQVRGHVDNGRFELVFGQRRLLAAREAGLTHITAVVEPGSLPVARAITQLVENLQRQDLGPLEEARAFRQLLEADQALTQAELARQIGRSAPYVSNALRILELAPKVLPFIESGQLSGGHAKALAGAEKKQQVDLADRAVKQDWSVHELERQVGYERDQAKARAELLAKTEKVADEAEQLLAAAGATKEASTLAGAGYYSTEAYKVLKKRGWTVRDKMGYRRGEACDCDAWSLDLTWQGKLERVQRSCVSEAHEQAQRAAEERTWKEKRAKTERAEKEAAAQRAKMLRPVVDYVAGDDTPFRRRLQLFALVDVDYRATDRFLERWEAKHQTNWNRVPAKVWGAITRLRDDQISAELATALAAGILTADTPAGLRQSLQKNVPGLQPASAKKAAKP